MAPTEYVFAVRAQDKARIFERSEDYIRYFAAEDQETLRDWVLSIRCAKVKRFVPLSELPWCAYALPDRVPCNISNVRNVSRIL